MWLVTPQTGRFKTRTLQPLNAEQPTITTSPRHTLIHRSRRTTRRTTALDRILSWSPGRLVHGLPKCIAPSHQNCNFEYQPYLYPAASLRSASPDTMSPPLAPINTAAPLVRASEDTADGRYSREIESPILSPASVVSTWSEGKKPHSRFRHTIGIVLLLATVFLWTASNFLASVRSTSQSRISWKKT